MASPVIYKREIKTLRLPRVQGKRNASYTPSTTILSLRLFSSGESTRIYVGFAALVPPNLSPSSPTFRILAAPEPAGVPSLIHGLAPAPGRCSSVLCCLETLICLAIDTSTALFPAASSSAWPAAGAYAPPVAA